MKKPDLWRLVLDKLVLLFMTLLISGLLCLFPMIAMFFAKNIWVGISLAILAMGGGGAVVIWMAKMARRFNWPPKER